MKFEVMLKSNLMKENCSFIKLSVCWCFIFQKPLFVNEITNNTNYVGDKLLRLKQRDTFFLLLSIYFISYFVILKSPNFFYYWKIWIEYFLSRLNMFETEICHISNHSDINDNHIKQRPSSWDDSIFCKLLFLIFFRLHILYLWSIHQLFQRPSTVVCFIHECFSAEVRLEINNNRDKLKDYF